MVCLTDKAPDISPLLSTQLALKGAARAHHLKRFEWSDVELVLGSRCFLEYLLDQ